RPPTNTPHNVSAIDDSRAIDVRPIRNIGISSDNGERTRRPYQNASRLPRAPWRPAALHPRSEVFKKRSPPLIHASGARMDAFRDRWILVVGPPVRMH